MNPPEERRPGREILQALRRYLKAEDLFRKGVLSEWQIEEERDAYRRIAQSYKWTEG